MEAGATLTGAFLNSDRWDELVLYVAPKLLGGTARSLADVDLQKLVDAIGGTITDVTPIAEDLRIIMQRQIP